MPRTPWRTLLAGLALGILACLLVGTVVAGLILFGGIYDVAADRPHNRLVAWMIHTTMISSIRRDAKMESPSRPVTPAVLRSGAVEYEAHCIACHGGPGVARAPWVSAMLPTPPFLIDSKVRWSRAELRLLIRGGVKMTAMPAWGEILPPEKIDDLTDFVRAMPAFSPAQFEQIRNQVRAQPAVAQSGP